MWNIYKNVVLFDLQKTIHDSLLVLMLILGFANAMLVLFGLPYIIPTPSKSSLYLILALLAITLFNGLIIGLINGFLLLEDRVDGTYIAVQMTSFGSKYIQYRLSTSLIFSFILSLMLLGIFRYFWHDYLFLNYLNLISVAFLISLLSSTICFIIGMNANGKLEGFTLLKIISFILSLPLLSFIPYLNQLQTTFLKYLLYMTPSYWPIVLLQDAFQQSVFFAGVFSNLVWLGLAYLIYHVTRS